MFNKLASEIRDYVSFTKEAIKFNPTMTPANTGLFATLKRKITGQAPHMRPYPSHVSPQDVETAAKLFSSQAFGSPAVKSIGSLPASLRGPNDLLRGLESNVTESLVPIMRELYRSNPERFAQRFSSMPGYAERMLHGIV